MPSIVARLTHIPGHLKHVDLRHGKGIVAHVVETGEVLGASYAAARVNTQLGAKAQYRGYEISYLFGLIGKGVAVLADAAGYSLGGALPHLSSLASGALAAHVAAIGAEHGMAAASSQKSLPAKKTTALGALPQAAPGKFLDFGRINDLANMHG